MKLVNERKVKVNYWVVIKIPKGIESARVYLALPPEHLNQKDVQIEKIEPEPIEIASVGENRIASFDLKISTKIEVRCRYSSYEALLEDSAEKLDKKAYEEYTRSEPLIEITPEIKELARSIIGDEKDEIEQARAIFDWVRGGIRYKKSGINLGNLTTLRKRKGDCGGMSFLFVSLCRSIGIPARCIFGWWTFGSGKVSPHGWAECYTTKTGWIPVDCSTAVLTKRANSLKGLYGFYSGIDLYDTPRDPEYYFGNIDNKRIIYSVGTNLLLEPPYPDQKFDRDDYKKWILNINDREFVFGRESIDGRILFLQPFHLFFAREDEKNKRYPSFDSRLRVDAGFGERLVYLIHIIAAAAIVPSLVLGWALGFISIFLIPLTTHAITSILLYKHATRIFWCLILLMILLLSIVLH
jgi:transglutaminase-like putative cysteine protease